MFEIDPQCLTLFDAGRQQEVDQREQVGDVEEERRCRPAGGAAVQRTAEGPVGALLPNAPPGSFDVRATMETLLFALLWAGVIGLTLAIASGFATPTRCNKSAGRRRAKGMSKNLARR